MGFMRRAVAAAGAMTLVAGTVVVAVPASAAPTVAPTKTYKACANKDTGAIRLVVKGKKCTKSELKLSWNVQGPAGMAGPVGPQGPTGATGPQGAQGPAGTSAVRIPSGTTVVGVAGFDGHTVTSAAGNDVMLINLPGDAGKALTDADVKLAPTPWAKADSQSALCTGSVGVPTAPTGMVCIYVSGAGGLELGSVASGVAMLPRSSFFVSWDYNAAAVMDEYLQVTWAYTAP